MRTSAVQNLPDRVQDFVRAWAVHVGSVTLTESSVVVFGERAGRDVVLKVVRDPHDEWRSGRVVTAFNGRGMVRALECADGAVLLERLAPAEGLVSLTRADRDPEATDIFAHLLASMSPDDPPRQTPTVADWARGFETFMERREERIPTDLVRTAYEVFTTLCVTQTHPRLLHGDLHHYNILLDASRGWLAVDPKGVVGELEFEEPGAGGSCRRIPRSARRSMLLPTAYRGSK
jgi:streptomycin 6-kinase